MLQRVFLGWDRPFLTTAVDWLLERREELPGMLVVVPTSQSGRRLREALATAAEALLSPTIVTPGSFLKTVDPAVAADWMERITWLETLEAIGDWAEFQELFPEPPDESGPWASGLAGELTKLRHSLQENGHTLTSAARQLSATVEAGRWDALGRLETLVERRLRAWALKSRSRVLAEGVRIPATGASSVVLAGITEMPPLVERALLAHSGPVTALVAAPETEAASFSAIGKPLPVWTERTMPWPGGDTGSVRLTADNRQQAAEAFRAVAEAKTPSDEVALGSADNEAGDELARVFTRGAWPAFHPAAEPVTRGLSRWFKIWCVWLADPKLSTLGDLLTLPETGILVSGRRAQKAERLSRLRNQWMILRPDDLRHRITTTPFRSDHHRESAEDVLVAVETLERWRADLLRGNFMGTLERLLITLGHSGDDTKAEADAMTEWLEGAKPMMRHVERDAGFWIELMLSDLPSPAPQPPEGRVIDVQGWLELLFEPGRHLVLCGMNEGKVPARNTGDPWLGEAASAQLGLSTDSARAARDAFLYQTMLESRRTDGRVDVICAKSGDGGEAFLPSRLLLAADRQDLPARVAFLFRGIEPPEAGLRWHADWEWQARAVEIPARLSATSFAAYLACPFRFYLKHAVNMQTPKPDRIEWNARDFGTVAHDVLERWGRDPEARDFSKTEAIHDWLSNELDRIVAEWFGERPPLAVRVQTEALRQRFSWLARTQACTRAEGWEIAEVEHKFEIKYGEATVVAKIDRIDRHRETGALRVIDYKTGRVDGVENSHRRKMRAGTRLPAHLPAESPAIYEGEERGKTAEFQWTNLQLPLYAIAVNTRDKVLPTPCYFTLGSTAADVEIHEWADFSQADLEAANHCAEWIARQILTGQFWPPAEKAKYDDFEMLGAGRALEDVMLPPT